MVHAVDDVARLIVDSVGPVEAMKLQKLIYYSQAWHLSLTDEPLFPNGVEAWSNGPVVYSVWDQHRGQAIVREWPSGDVNRLSPRAAQVISLVCQAYGHMSGNELSRRTHSEEPWKAAREGTPDGAPSAIPLSRDVMASAYRNESLAGYDAADLAVSLAESPAAPAVDCADMPEPLGRGSGVLPSPDSLARLDYPRGPSRVRPARLS